MLRLAANCLLLGALVWAFTIDDDQSLGFDPQAVVEKAVDLLQGVSDGLSGDDAGETVPGETLDVAEEAGQVPALVEAPTEVADEPSQADAVVDAPAAEEPAAEAAGPSAVAAAMQAEDPVWRRAPAPASPDLAAEDLLRMAALEAEVEAQAEAEEPAGSMVEADEAPVEEPAAQETDVAARPQEEPLVAEQEAAASTELAAEEPASPEPIEKAEEPAMAGAEPQPQPSETARVATAVVDAGGQLERLGDLDDLAASMEEFYLGTLAASE